MATTSVSSRRGTTPLIVESISEQLYSILCDRITTGVYAPGSRLDPQAMANEFGVSRTPVRDTLARLEHDRLVETRPRSGTFVTRPTRQDVHEVCQLRKGLEWLATGVAAETMPVEQITDLRDEAVAALRAAEQGDYEPFFASDTRIHGEIIAFTGNSRLITARESVEPFVYWLRVLGATGPHRLAGSTQRHIEILDAMAARDVAAAQEAAALHLAEVEEWTLADMASHEIVT
ncbi:GntR family transcriptional regulator [Streptomyces aurantiacus]|uniref:GntR family transcriptional regulator n=1 Tax=Streptomyces aurantiacus TaxID=47760 RepID=A0A7G1NSC8_9ACTN|nr:GntR family transcriptional regulator [Streptomyces aurantiacus]MDQ0771964.1 DNA-binding GntR family transcriptional regulator [Streptomyces aurantiacus]BCL25351.1 GntR family transcriptional regulator [Streptomyces aurantiacus]